jgi:hypothetical protein
MEARRGEKLPVVYGRKREGMAIERAKATNKIHSVCFILRNDYVHSIVVLVASLLYLLEYSEYVGVFVFCPCSPLTDVTSIMTSHYGE